MEESKQKPDQMSLGELIADLKKGTYVIPGFQREFKWRPTDINDLMHSIFRDYYIGNLLLWKEKERNFIALNCEPIYGAPEPRRPALIVLDGQQRLSAMYYSFFAPEVPPPKLKKRTFFFIRVNNFMKKKKGYEEEFHHGSNGRTLELFKNRKKQFEEHMFPLALIGQGELKRTSWVRDYEKYWEKKEEEIEDVEASRKAGKNAQNGHKFGERLLKIIDEYQIAYIQLDPDMELEKVCETFTKINTKGVKLDIFDLMNAYLRPKGLELKKMWSEAKDKDDLKFMKTDKTKIFVLQAMSVSLQYYFSQNYLYNLIPGREQEMGDDSSGEKVLIKNKESFERFWGEAVVKLCNAIALLNDPRGEYGIISSKYIPYTSILPVFAVLNDEAEKLEVSEQRLSANDKIKQWYWGGAFTRRYQSQADSTNAKDYQELIDWFKNDAAEPAWIFEFKKHIDGIKMREATQPTGSIYKGVFNLLMLKGAKDWMNGKKPPLDGNFDNHHIVPRSWGKEKKHALTTSIDTILNITPMSARTNRDVIGKRLPYEYLPELIKEHGKDKVLKILESHFISHKAFNILMKKSFTPADYENFIEEREDTILKAIKKRVLD